MVSVAINALSRRIAFRNMTLVFRNELHTIVDGVFQDFDYQMIINVFITSRKILHLKVNFLKNCFYLCGHNAKHYEQSN